MQTCVVGYIQICLTGMNPVQRVCYTIQSCSYTLRPECCNCPCALTSTASSGYWFDHFSCPSVSTSTAVSEYWLERYSCQSVLTNTAVRMSRQTWQEPPSESAAQLPSASAASHCTAWSAQPAVLSLGPALKPSMSGTGPDAPS